MKLTVAFLFAIAAGFAYITPAQAQSATEQSQAGPEIEFDVSELFVQGGVDSVGFEVSDLLGEIIQEASEEASKEASQDAIAQEQ